MYFQEYSYSSRLLALQLEHFVYNMPGFSSLVTFLYTIQVNIRRLLLRVIHLRRKKVKVHLFIPYSGKHSREKTFTNFTAIRESFLHEILCMPHPLCMQPVLAFRKFSRNTPFLPIRESYLPRKFPAIRYGWE